MLFCLSCFMDSDNNGVYIMFHAELLMQPVSFMLATHHSLVCQRIIPQDLFSSEFFVFSVTLVCVPMAVGQSISKLWIYGDFMCKTTGYLQGVFPFSSRVNFLLQNWTAASSRILSVHGLEKLKRRRETRRQLFPFREKLVFLQSKKQNATLNCHTPFLQAFYVKCKTSLEYPVSVLCVNLPSSEHSFLAQSVLWCNKICGC